MQIRISANPIGPLKVLAELPDAPLAVLEGLNGIGKTLAVRLLQICAGTLPYSTDSLAWTSLCQGLGEFDVLVTGLSGGRQIRWMADTRDWTPGASATDFPTFRSIDVDGKKASIDEVRRLLGVYRVGGDEGIIETFAQQAESAGEALRRWSRRHAAEQGSPLAKLESVLGEAVTALGEWTSARLEDIQESVRDADITRRDAATAVEGALKRRDDLRSLAQFRAQLAAVESRGPDLIARAASLDSSLTKLQAERDRINQRITAVAGRATGGASVIRELRNARKTLERNRTNLSRTTNLAATTVAELGVASDAKAVAALLEQLAEELTALREEQTQLDAAPMMRQLLDGFTGQLADAEGRGLAGQIAIDDPETDTQLTVSQTRAGMAARRSYLEGQPPPPRARDVAERLAATQRRLSRARDAQAFLTEVDRWARLVRENEDRVARAVSASNPDAVAELQALEVERRAKDDELLFLAAERASLRQQLGNLGGGVTPEQLDAEIQHALSAMGISIDDLDETIARAETALLETQASLIASEENSTAFRREAARAAADVRRVSNIVAAGDEWVWVRASVPPSALPDVDASTSQQLLALDEVRGRLAATVERLGRHRTELGAVEEALRGIARHLRGQQREAREYVPELQAWLGHRFSDWFNNERVRSELLPDADGKVTVDLERRDVEWAAAGAPRSRPLEAFSSGEQAFAYTRARLAVLDEETPRPPNRLIALDEFGAFIAQDRLTGLLAYLRDRCDDHVGDQVLVILPLRQDYAEMSLNAVGSEAERLSRLAEEIEVDGFAVQLLSK